MNTQSALTNTPGEKTRQLGRVLLYERLDLRDTSPEWLRQQGFEVVLGRLNRDLSYKRYMAADLIDDAQGCVAVLGSSGADFDRETIASLPLLRYISKLGIGVDNIDVAAATEHGVLVSNTPDDSDVIAVAEHAITMLFALKKRLPVWTQDFMRQGGWRSDVFSSLIQGSAIGIVGFGRIGRAVASRLRNWGASVLVYDPYVDQTVEGVSFVDLPVLLAAADAVTLHCPPSADNLHLLNRETLALMKPSAVLVNTGRGSLVDYEALRIALMDGTISGAALDVYESEPPDVNDALFRLPNVITTPHAASWTLEGFLKRRMHAAKNLHAMAAGVGSANIVNPEAIHGKDR